MERPVRLTSGVLQGSFFGPLLFIGYREFQNTRDNVTEEEERKMVARLVFATLTQVFCLPEDLNFQNFENIKPYLVRSSVTLFGCLLCLLVVLGYGILNFIVYATHHEDLKTQVLVAIFAAVEIHHPFTQTIGYLWQSKNMVKLINQYPRTCRGISKSLRKFYRSQTFQRLSFVQFLLFNVSLILIYHYVNGTYCFDDPKFICGLFITLRYPRDTNYFPVREIIVLLSMVVVLHMVTFQIAAGIDTYTLGELFEYKVQSLIDLMKKTSLSRRQNIEIVRRNFRRIVDYHQELIECFGLIRDILGGVAVASLISFIPFVTAISAKIVTNPNVAHVNEFLVLVAGCFCWSVSLQRLTDLGDVLDEVAYSMDWYEMDKEMNKEFLLFMMKLKRPLKIRSLLFELKKPIFLSMMRSVYSFMMLMLEAK